MGSKNTSNTLDAHSNVDRIFETMDLNRDGLISMEEFVQYCTSTTEVRESLEVRDPGGQPRIIMANCALFTGPSITAITTNSNNPPKHTLTRTPRSQVPTPNIFATIAPSIHAFICLPIYLSVSPSIDLSIYPYIHPSSRTPSFLPKRVGSLSVDLEIRSCNKRTLWNDSSVFQIVV